MKEHLNPLRFQRHLPFVIAYQLAGLMIAAAALTRPTLQYFIIPLIFLLMFAGNRASYTRLIIPLVAGFLLTVSPWALRNLSVIGSFADPSLTTNSVHHGIYPDFMYQDIPESRAIPYRFDPRSEEISNSKENLLGEIRRRFTEEPMRHLEWYLLGKPAHLLDWDIIAGMGDIYIYHVADSPYTEKPTYIQTRKYMRILHWPAVYLALIATLLVWLPVFRGKLSDTVLFTTRLLSLLMLYFIALHIAAAPYPRYGIPLRPVIYGLAMLFCSLTYTWMKSGIGRAKKLGQLHVR